MRHWSTIHHQSIPYLPVHPLNNPLTQQKQQYPARSPCPSRCQASVSHFMLREANIFLEEHSSYPSSMKLPSCFKPGTQFQPTFYHQSRPLCVGSNDEVILSTQIFPSMPIHQTDIRLHLLLAWLVRYRLDTLEKYMVQTLSAPLISDSILDTYRNLLQVC